MTKFSRRILESCCRRRTARQRADFRARMTELFYESGYPLREERYGLLDVETMKEVVKRPVAMASNLHDAIFLPETLDLHFAYANATQPACDCPYHHLNLAELIRDYQTRLQERE